jgi:hypothetical protein
MAKPLAADLPSQLATNQNPSQQTVIMMETVVATLTGPLQLECCTALHTTTSRSTRSHATDPERLPTSG